ncbi:MAG: tRNA (adenosine(37)-N6)-threonylcarbamoyltransferase complex ATPase subunit type 1 TsaE [bacterium]
MISFKKEAKNESKTNNWRTEKRIVSNSPEETERLGEEFAYSLNPGDVVALIGELGSGKTVFIKGVCRGLNVEDDITSPTFTLIHEYNGRVPVYHLDFYRIKKSDEIRELGYDEYLLDEGICLIEWAERSIEHLPEKRFEIYFKNFFKEGLENRREIRICKL